MNWIEKLWHGWGDVCPMEPIKLPPPTRPAPHMPECRPPKQDISEPVITLLEELRKDVWEVKQVQYGYDTRTVTHVFKEDVILLVTGCSTESCRLCNQDWMTPAEQSVVQEAVSVVIRGQIALAAKLRLINSRAKFSKALGVQNEVH